MVHILRISLDDEKYLYLEISAALHWYLCVKVNPMTQRMKEKWKENKKPITRKMSEMLKTTA